MDYGSSDGSGTDDDFPPNQNHGTRGGRVAGNGVGIVGEAPCSSMQIDMKRQIHRLEQEAYSAVLLAFKAQSDAITWEKESLITELRKELRVSDEEHRRLLSQVNAEDIIRKIREWRQAGEPRPISTNAQPSNNPMPSPSVSASRKRQRTSQSIPSVPLRAPLPELHSQAAETSRQPSASVAKQGSMAGAKGNKLKPYSDSSRARDQATVRNLPGALAATEPGEAPGPQSLVGKKVMTKWPDDNNFYEAIITEYNPANGKHRLIYDIHTENETYEWIDLKEFGPEDIRWVGEEHGLSDRGGQSGPVIYNKYSKHHSKKGYVSSQNRFGMKTSDHIEIFHTETLLKEVERVHGASHPNSLELDNAKNMLKEHEQSLINAIARLADASDGESGEEDQFSQRQSLERNQAWRNRHYPRNRANYQEMVCEGQEVSDGD